MKIKKLFPGLLMSVGFLCSVFQLFGSEKTLDVLKNELTREFEILNQQSPPVYYLDYRLEHVKRYYVMGSLGYLSGKDSMEYRRFSPNMRIGSIDFDDTHIVKGVRSRILYKSATFPIENGVEAMQNVIWKSTNEFYESARSNFQQKKNKIKPEDETDIDDFLQTDAVEYVEPYSELNLSEDKLTYYQDLVVEISKEFQRDGAISQGNVVFGKEFKRKYFVSSENQVIAQNFPVVRMVIMGAIKSDEGNEMPLFKEYFAFSEEKLPTKEELMNDARILVDKLIELKNATIAEPYTGPAILSPEASGVFFHEIFGHRVEGHRLKDDTDAQTFKSKVGERVLPKTFSITFRPEQKDFNGVDLNGFYHYDDQGVKANEVNVIENGVLNDFLMCRTPIEGFSKSNGHGRGDISRGSVARQSNMFISASKTFSMDDLRKKLVKACKKQNLEYGYYFKNVVGGFTNTSRIQPNAFNVNPTEVYRIYVDGRPDELVRGVDLVGTPLAMFSTIAAAGDDWGIFNGTCGAESGGVPVSAISPSIFVEKIETQKKNQKYSNGPVLPPPGL